MTILAAGVGEHMVGVAGECADGFVGHTIASAGYLRDTAVRSWPRARPGRTGTRRGGPAAGLGSLAAPRQLGRRR